MGDRGFKRMTKNFKAFVKLNKTGLQNKYVIIVDGKIIIQGEDIENMLEKVKLEYPEKMPLVAKVPDARMLVL